MKILFRKGSNGPDHLVYAQTDGSLVEEALLPGSAYHDIAHYVVETTLNLRDGLWGHILQGYRLADYALPNAERPFQISTEGYHAEILATLIQSAVLTGEISPAYIEMLRQANAAAGLPFPELPPAQLLTQMIAETQLLTRRWESEEYGLELEMRF
jgi:hypothetical protein